MKTMTEAAAKSQGYRPLTIAYNLPKEQDMLDTVLADMRRGNIEAVLVPGYGGPEVWRRGQIGN